MRLRDDRPFRRQQVASDELIGQAERLLRQSDALIAISRSLVLSSQIALDRASRRVGRGSTQ